MEDMIEKIIKDRKLDAIGFQPSIKSRTLNFNRNMFDENICLYIHIPFCKKKCSFCGFFSTSSYTTDYLNKYTDAIIQEIENYSNTIFANKKIEAIHFGGGTPSLLSMDNFNKILMAIKKYLNTSSLKEILIEANPSSLDKEKILQYSEISKIKLNIGIQTFDEKSLSKINREEDLKHINYIIREGMKSNIQGIGIDLICGLPGSSIQGCIKDIDYAINLGVDYITLYPLWVEKNTTISELAYKNDNKFINYYDKKQMYICMNEKLLKNNYKRLSIYHWSNKDKPNYLYGQRQMEGKNWIGLGAGAESYVNGLTFNNILNINNYMKNVFNSDFAIDKVLYLNIEEQFLREIAFGLRLMPLKLENIKRKYGEKMIKNIYQKFNELEKMKLINIERDKIFLTYDGILNLKFVEDYIIKSK